MQAHVDEVGGELLDGGEAAGAVGDHQGAAAIFEEAEEVRGDPARVPDLQGVAMGELGGEGALQPGEGRRAGGAPREEVEEGAGALPVEGQRGRELPEEGARLVAQLQHAARVEGRQGVLDVGERARVGDEAAALHGEEEPGRHGVRPAAEEGGRLEAVKGAVQLDGGEGAGEVGEIEARGEARRVEAAAPLGVGVAAGADPHASGHGGAGKQGAGALAPRAICGAGGAVAATAGERRRAHPAGASSSKLPVAMTSLASRLPAWISPLVPATWSDLLLLPASAEILDAGPEALAVVCDERPEFWFGNTLVLRHPPRPEDAPRLVAAWRAVFADRPEVQRMIWQWETPLDAPPPALSAPWTWSRSPVLALDAGPPRSLGSPRWPAAPARSQGELDAVLGVLLSALAGDEREADFLRWRFAQYTPLLDARAGTWWAARDGAMAVGAAGIFAVGDLARFQNVVTRASHRRRGVCSDLCGAMLADQAARHLGGRVVIVAEGAAERVYQRLGFTPIAAQWAAIAPRPGAHGAGEGI